MITFPEQAMRMALELKEEGLNRDLEFHRLLMPQGPWTLQLRLIKVHSRAILPWQILEIVDLANSNDPDILVKMVDNISKTTGTTSLLPGTNYVVELEIYTDHSADPPKVTSRYIARSPNLEGGRQMFEHFKSALLE